jgi:hypothetical protein
MSVSRTYSSAIRALKGNADALADYARFSAAHKDRSPPLKTILPPYRCSGSPG